MADSVSYGGPVGVREGCQDVCHDESVGDKQALDLHWCVEDYEVLLNMSKAVEKPLI